MRSTNETGHAKNVAYFEELIAYCQGYGAAYQPSKGSMQLSSMQQLLMEARTSLVVVTNRLTAYISARNARIEAFEGLPTLASRVVNALAATDTADKTVEDARGIVRKIKGVRVSKKEDLAPKTEPALLSVTEEANAQVPATNAMTNDNGSTTRSHSAAQTSRDQLIEHFARLLALLQSEPAYQLNEPELQLPNLQMYLNTLRSTNSAVLTQEVEWSNARIQRDQFLYYTKTCICDVAQDVKQYTKAAFGLSSPQYKQISGLRFVRSAK